MLALIRSASLWGLEALLVEVEVDVSTGLPSFHIVGLPDTAVQEAKERVRAAFANAEYEFPLKRITVNLAPAHVRKEGPAFDLPIALGILAATGQVPSDKIRDFLIIGELSLTGEIRPIKGALALAQTAQQAQLSLIIPKGNCREAALIEDLMIIPATNLRQAVAFLRGDDDVDPFRLALDRVFTGRCHYDHDFADVKGQDHAKRALEIAAAGGHNLLMIGPPGSGKTMLARCAATILPNLNREEALDVSKICSAAGLCKPEDFPVTRRPFRAPHHCISTAGLVGGGHLPRPGEISLSHHGLLFLDELPEFSRPALEALRQPLEDGTITISRAQANLTYPSSFMLVAAMNPCPCGYLGDSFKECRCSYGGVKRYRERISGPLLDRLDLQIEIPRLPKTDLTQRPAGEPSASIKNRVEAARARQSKRFVSATATTCNAQMSPRQIRQFCAIDGPSTSFLETAIEKLGLSARAFDRALKVARTISDLAGRDNITLEDLAEALQYRQLDRDYLG